jgi:very-short-patch-repair endonuclease
MPVRNTVIGQKLSPGKIEAAKAMRYEPTEAEKALWICLRGNRMDGWHFRRQQIITGYIVDFYCHAASLIIEVDGDIHLQQVDYDRDRDQILCDAGYRVLRFRNQQVIETVEAVLNIIRENLSSLPPSRNGKGVGG